MDLTENEHQRLADAFFWAGLRFVDFRKIRHKHVYLLVPLPHEGRMFDAYLYFDRQEAKEAKRLNQKSWEKLYLRRVSRREALELKGMANYKRVRSCERVIRDEY